MLSVGLFEVEILVIFSVDEVVDGEEALLVLLAVLAMWNGWDFVDGFFQIVMDLVFAHYIVITDYIKLLFIFFGRDYCKVVLLLTGTSVVGTVQYVLHFLEMLVIVHTIGEYFQRSGI